MKRLGVIIKEDELNKRKHLEDNSDHDELNEDMDEVDWAASGFTGPVKD